MTDTIIIADREKYADKNYDWGLVEVGDSTYALGVCSRANVNQVTTPSIIVAQGEIYGRPLATQIPLAWHDNGDGTVSLCVVRHGGS